MTARKLFITLTMLMACNHAAAKAPVWKVTNGERSLFIGGTIHLLSKQDYPLPEAFNLAFEQSAELVFETDIEGANSFATQAKFLPALMYQDGSTIESRLKPETYSKLKSFLQARKLPLSMFERFKPAGVNLTLLVMELERLGIHANSGVEMHLNAKAKKDEKTVAWLESIDEQIEFIERMNSIDADVLINTTIDDLGKLKKEWPKLLSAWKNGDMDKLANLGFTDMLEKTPDMYQFMLVDRNKDWVPQIKDYMATPEIEFVLVGALHLAGKDSVLLQLKEEGFEIEQLD